MERPTLPLQERLLAAIRFIACLEKNRDYKSLLQHIFQPPNPVGAVFNRDLVVAGLQKNRGYKPLLLHTFASTQPP